MKRSPPTTPSCSSSSSSSNSPIQSEEKKPKTKRSRKNNSDKCQNASSPTSGRRSSIYRGVTRHRWTGRYEAHLWDKSSWNSIQNKKGRQVYLGAYDSEEAAAHTYDLAALKYWGPETILNFPIETYTKELEGMQKVSKEEYLASLRRRSSGFSRGVSKYRGVARHHHNGRWEARIGRVYGNKYLYLGTYNTQEEAAAAYDMAALEYRGANAVTNFDISNYIERLKKKGINIVLPQDPIQNSSNESEQPQQQQQLLLPQHQKEEDEEAGVRVEVEVEQPPQQPQYHPQQQLEQQQQEEKLSPQLDYTHFIDTPPMVIMDPAGNNELDWSFYMDLAGFTNEFPVPDFSLGKSGNDLPDLMFGDIGFEDNIDLIFESPVSVESEARLLDSPTSCGVANQVVDGGVLSVKMEEENEKERLLSCSSTCSPSSSTSTTTSVSCNYLA